MTYTQSVNSYLAKQSSVSKQITLDYLIKLSTSLFSDQYLLSDLVHQYWVPSDSLRKFLQEVSCIIRSNIILAPFLEQRYLSGEHEKECQAPPSFPLPSAKAKFCPPKTGDEGRRPKDSVHFANEIFDRPTSTFLDVRGYSLYVLNEVLNSLPAFLIHRLNCLHNEVGM